MTELAGAERDLVKASEIQRNGYLVQPRRYQEEMLRLSMNQNIIVAMDTGSGKTAIAVLRIREELEQCAKGKTVWFLCPTVALAEQQCSVIRRDLPAFPSRILSGKDGVDTWRTRDIWNQALGGIDIIVCTHQVLVDALSHGFVRMDKIAMLVFDEAHHCTRDHPANQILQTFYHPLKRERPGAVPHILGLTASPVTKTKVNSLQIIEGNLDALSRTPKLHRDELMTYVHRPVMTTLSYCHEESPSPPLLLQLVGIYEVMDIHKDPYVVSLAAKRSPLYLKTILNQKTYSREQMKKFVSEAKRIHHALGTWASNELIITCAQRYLQMRKHDAELLEGTDSEKQYLCDMIAGLNIGDFDDVEDNTSDGISQKVAMLVDILVKDMKADSAGIVFVERRADVALLSKILARHPATKDLLRIGTFIGTSEFTGRAWTLPRMIETKNEESTLDDLRTGAKNLIVCTSVCEEGIDISACNFVICFDPLANLKSFIQRRGRARHEKSRFTLMLPQGGNTSADILSQWLMLEKKMEEQYMDDMRLLKDLKELESEEEDYRELKVETTGAKITLHNAVQHLYHFCNKLPRANHTILVPIFSYDTEIDEDAMINSAEERIPKSLSCTVILPNAVDASVRECRSLKSWPSEKMARRDAAFEAYVQLHEAGLLNANLLPSPQIDEEVAKAYAEIAKRPSLAEVAGQFDPWPNVAAAWVSTTKVYEYRIDMAGTDRNTQVMQLISPLILPAVPAFRLYVNADLSYLVNLSGPRQLEKDTAMLSESNVIMDRLLRSLYSSKMPVQEVTFPLLFVPSTNNNRHWLSETTGTYPASQLLTVQSLESQKHLGIIRDATKCGAPYSFHGIERGSEEDGATSPKQFLRCRRLPKRRDFLHPIPDNNQLVLNDQDVLLDPETCTVDRLPHSVAHLAMFIPSIMHRISTTLLTTHLCQTILAPVGFSSAELVLPAISTASAQESNDYQRLEFLGDSILKTLTSISLAADHPQWHEGYLSNQKDHIVSNGRLAVAAQVTGIDRFILTTPFTGQKWKPPYNEALLPQTDPPRRQLSTKTLADIVEALLGAAYLDGGFPRALNLLRIFLPEIPWQPLHSYSTSLLSHAAPLPSTYTNTHLSRLESLLGYTFAHKSLLIEALTHPSYPSTSAHKSTSYQRLEFLGDALLDYIVVSTIYAHALPLHKMHLLRTAAVNASFLAFRSLATTISAPNTTTATTPLSLLSFLRAAPSAPLTAAISTTRSRFTALSPEISTALSDPATSPYPWRLLAAFAPEKVVSDLVEAVVAAVWIDSGGDFEACGKVVRKLGILGFVAGRARVGGVGLWHPKEEIGWAAGGRRVEYKVEVEGGNYTCNLHVENTLLCTVRGSNRLEAETAAAEMGIRVLREDAMRSRGVGVGGGGGSGGGGCGAETDTIVGAEEGGDKDVDGDADIKMGDAEEEDGGGNGVPLGDVEMS